MFVFLLIVSLLTPLIMFCMGSVWKKHPPKKTNEGYGYRTRRSMASQAAWDFAHRYSGRIWFWAGLALAVVSTSVIFLFQDHYENAVLWLMILQIAVVIASIIPVEKALKKNFDKDGTPKEQ